MGGRSGVTGKEDLKRRTKSLGVEIARLVNQLPRSVAGDVLGRQLLRSATSVGANYRAACRAQTRAVFTSKLAIVIEECDEAAYWLELLLELGLVPESEFLRLHREADELTAIFVASRKTAIANSASTAAH
jgi:four helix bundle protein